MKDFKPFTIIDEQDDWKLLERQTINDRTLICHYNPDMEDFTITLFCLHQTNALSRRVSESSWGFATKFITNISTTNEAAEVAGLYLQDMEKGNFWWEIDGKVH